MAYKITWTDDNGIIVIFSGTIDDAEYINSHKERWKDPEVLKHCRYVIADYANVQEVKVTSEGIRQGALFCIKASKLNNSLYLVGILPTKLTFGMARMLQAYADSTGWKMFPAKTMEEAIIWLNDHLE